MMQKEFKVRGETHAHRHAPDRIPTVSTGLSLVATQMSVIIKDKDCSIKLYQTTLVTTKQ
jgi:hypothetical protein